MNIEQERLVKINVKLIHQFIKTHFPYGEVTKKMTTAARLLIHPNAEHTRLYERIGKNETIEVPVKTLYLLADELEWVDKEKFAGSVIVAQQERAELQSGDATKAEIEVLVWGKNLLEDMNFHPTNKYVSVYVDDVQFRQKDSSDMVKIMKGKFVRIGIPSGLPGAVVLPVDAETGDVLLVTQYRHPQRRFLTEAPRGFGMLGVDDGAVDTARREMAEEAGAMPIKGLDGIEELFFLKSLYTDTGKLMGAPHYYLAFVDRKLQLAKLNRQEPTMESPVWVGLEVFFKAVRANGAIALQDNEFEHTLNPNHKQKLNIHTVMEDGILQIEDALTTLVSFLALPHLIQRFPNLDLDS